MFAAIEKFAAKWAHGIKLHFDEAPSRIPDTFAVYSVISSTPNAQESGFDVEARDIIIQLNLYADDKYNVKKFYDEAKPFFKDYSLELERVYKANGKWATMMQFRTTRKEYDD